MIQVNETMKERIKVGAVVSTEELSREAPGSLGYRRFGAKPARHV